MVVGQVLILLRAAYVVVIPKRSEESLSNPYAGLRSHYRDNFTSRLSKTKGVTPLFRSASWHGHIRIEDVALDFPCPI